MGEPIKSIVRYQECLEKYSKREDTTKLLHCIGKLCKLPVTIDHLTDTGVGRTVNSLRRLGGDVSERAKTLVTKWKEMVTKAEEAEEKEKKRAVEREREVQQSHNGSSSNKDDKRRSKHKSSRREHEKDKLKEHKTDEKDSHRKSAKRKHDDKSRRDKNEHKTSEETKAKHRKSHKHKDEKKSDTKSKTKRSSKTKEHSKKDASTEDGIGSGSGTSFADALWMLEPSSIKTSKKKSITPPLSVSNDSDENGSSFELQTSPPSSKPTSPPSSKPLNLNFEMLPNITPNYKPKSSFPLLDDVPNRSKMSAEDETLSAIMYNKISRTKVYSGNKSGWGKVSSLFDLCTRVLQDNIDALEFTGGVPYTILKPVLERANHNQLNMLEQYNPYLLEDTDDLWKIHCQRDFRNRSLEEFESWRDMYQRCLEEREIKLKALTANIRHLQDKSTPVRQTKLAYVDSVVKPPRNVARKQAKHGTADPANKKPYITPSSRLAGLATKGAAGEIRVPNPGKRAASASNGGFNAIVKPKKAPMMQKTLAMMKNRFRR